MKNRLYWATLGDPEPACRSRLRVAIEVAASAQRQATIDSVPKYGT